MCQASVHINHHAAMRSEEESGWLLGGELALASSMCLSRYYTYIHNPSRSLRGIVCSQLSLLVKVEEKRGNSVPTFGQIS